MVIGTGGFVLDAYGRVYLAGSDDKLKSMERTVSPPYYPPTLTGMRGSHEGSYEVAHALAWEGKKPECHERLDEHYDLVVVGAGMSGLAAAHYYRKKWGQKQVF